MSINITPKEFQRRMIGAANRHHAAMQGMTDNQAASYVRRTVEAAVIAFGVYPNAGAPHGMGLYVIKGGRYLQSIILSGQQDRFPIDAIPCDDLEQAMAAEEAFGDEHIRNDN
jgi:hypothetical protein